MAVGQNPSYRFGDGYHPTADFSQTFLVCSPGKDTGFK